MTTLRQEIQIDAHPDGVWEAVRDFDAVHTRLARGFVTDALVEARAGARARTLTFFNGMVATELLVGIDDEHRRLAYAITEGQSEHYAASVQVFGDGHGRSRMLWIIDALPDALASYIGDMQAKGAAAVKETLESKVAVGG
jgi:hypothetical protein